MNFSAVSSFSSGTFIRRWNITELAPPGTDDVEQSLETHTGLGGGRDRFRDDGGGAEGDEVVDELQAVTGADAARMDDRVGEAVEDWAQFPSGWHRRRRS